MDGKVKKPRTNSAGNIIGYEIIGNDGKTYFAHLGDIQENENLLYELRDHKLKKLETVYDHFEDKLNKDEPVKFKGWDENKGNKPHAFNVKRTR
jgi:hypothetical protein